MSHDEQKASAAMTETLNKLIAKWRLEDWRHQAEPNHVRAKSQAECADELESALAGIARQQDDKEPTTLLDRAVADRAARPWNYYKLDHDVMKRILNQLQDKLEAAAGIARQPEQSANEELTRQSGAEATEQGAGSRPLTRIEKENA